MEGSASAVGGMKSTARRYLEARRAAMDSESDAGYSSGGPGNLQLALPLLGQTARSGNLLGGTARSGLLTHTRRSKFTDNDGAMSIASSHYDYPGESAALQYGHSALAVAESLNRTFHPTLMSEKKLVSEHMRQAQRDVRRMVSACVEGMQARELAHTQPSVVNHRMSLESTASPYFSSTAGGSSSAGTSGGGRHRNSRAAPSNGGEHVDLVGSMDPEDAMKTLDFRMPAEVRSVCTGAGLFGCGHGHGHARVATCDWFFSHGRALVIPHSCLRMFDWGSW